MKQLLFILSIFISGCSSHSYNKAENDLDAGREFIDASLKGDFDKANFYLLNDETNKKLFNQYIQSYNKKSADDKKQLHDAVINIKQVNAVNNKETIINFKNSFDTISHRLKVVSVNNTWLVDLKSSANF